MSYTLHTFNHALYAYGPISAQLALNSNKENFQQPQVELPHWTKISMATGKMDVARTITAFQRLVAESFRLSGEHKQVSTLPLCFWSSPCM